MKALRTSILLALLALGMLAPLNAAEPTIAPVRPHVVNALGADALSALFAAKTAAARLCPSYFCPIYIDSGCSCDWVECPDGTIACGVWNGTTVTSASSVAPAAFSPALTRR